MNSEPISFFPQGIVAFDLETTGLSPLFDEIIEIGGVKISPDGTTSNFQKLVHPGIPISPTNTLIHGITDATVAEAPPLEETLPQFLYFIGNASLIAHNAKFDTGFIVRALHRQGLPLIDNPVYCSLSLAKGIFRESPNNRLDTLAKLLSIPTSKHHRAWNDASTCLQLAFIALRQLKEHAPIHLDKSLIGRLTDYRHIESIPRHLSGLTDLVTKKKSMYIKYSGGSAPGTWRPVTFQSLLPLPTGNALYALCHRSNRYKFFYLKKIPDFKDIS